MSELEVAVSVLDQRVDNLEKVQDSLIKKFEGIQSTIFVILGGLVVNLLVLLLKK